MCIPLHSGENLFPISEFLYVFIRHTLLCSFMLTFSIFVAVALSLYFSYRKILYLPDIFRNRKKNCRSKHDINFFKFYYNRSRRYLNIVRIRIFIFHVLFYACFSIGNWKKRNICFPGSILWFSIWDKVWANF